MKPLSNAPQPTIRNEDKYRWLTELVFDCKELDKLGGLVSEFNLFEAMGMVRQEIRHSHFLGTLLNPRESHGLGARFFESLFSRLLYAASEDFQSEISLLEIDLCNYDDLQVFREQDRIDLLLVSEQNNQVFIIENKIDAGEHGNQLERYEHIINRRYPKHHKLFVFLTLEGDEASRKNWLSLSYVQVIECLAEILVDYGHQIPSAARIGIEHYITLFKRYFMEDTEIALLCQRIYKKHQKALDLIYEHIPQVSDANKERQQWLASVLDPYVIQHQWEEDSRTNAYLRYAYLPWDKKQPEMQSSSWTKSGRLILVEFVFAEKIQMKIVIGPTPCAPFRRQLVEYLVNSESWVKLYNRKLGQTQEFTTVYSRTLLDKNDLDEIEEEAFCARIQKILGDFFEQSWPVIRDELSPLFIATADHNNKEECHG